jgi:hypothetical protein
MSIFTIRCFSYNCSSWEKGSTDWALEAKPARLGFTNYYGLARRDKVSRCAPFPGYAYKNFERDGVPSDEPHLSDLLFWEWNSDRRLLQDWMYDDYEAKLLTEEVPKL